MKIGKLRTRLIVLGALLLGAGCGGNSTTGPSRGGFSSFNSGFSTAYGGSGGALRPGAPTNLPAVQSQRNLRDRLIRDLRGQGSWAFAITQNSLLVLDLSKPAQPKAVSQLPLPGTALSLDVTKTHAFVACGSGGLQVVDISDPSKPRKVGGWEPDLETQQVQAVAVQNGTAYLAVKSAGLVVMDVSDPKNVKPVTVLSDQVPDAERVVAAGSRVYLLEPGLTILDVSGPTAPRKLEELGAQRQTYDLGVWQGYVVSLTSLGVQVLDLSDLEKVRRIAQYETKASVPPVAGTRAVAPGGKGPAGVVGKETVVSGPASSAATALRGKSTGVQKPPSKSPGKGEATLNNPPQNRRLAIYDHYAYIAREADGLWILDLQGQDTLQRVGTVTGLGTATCCTLHKQWLLVGNREGGIALLDLKNPQEPPVVGRFEVKGK